MKLAGKVALVTGAARRVGRAIALQLAAARCKTAVHYNTSADEAADVVSACRREGVDAEAFQADLADREAPVRLVRDVLARFGRLDALVNNASAFAPMSITDFNLHAWDQTLRVNLTAPMVLAVAAREALEQSGGCVVNITDAATTHPWPDHLAYIVSKGALDTLTKALARGLAPNVRVVGVAPGVAAWPTAYDDETRERLTRRIPLGRAGKPEDIAAAVQFLLTAGDYITGAILPVDGGRQIV